MISARRLIFIKAILLHTLIKLYLIIFLISPIKAPPFNTQEHSQNSIDKDNQILLIDHLTYKNAKDTLPYF